MDNGTDFKDRQGTFHDTDKAERLTTLCWKDYEIHWNVINNISANLPENVFSSSYFWGYPLFKEICDFILYLFFPSINKEIFSLTRDWHQKQWCWILWKGILYLLLYVPNNIISSSKFISILLLHVSSFDFYPRPFPLMYLIILLINIINPVCIHFVFP